MKRFLCLVLTAMTIFALAVPASAVQINHEEDYILLTEEYVRTHSHGFLFAEEGISPLFSGVIAECQICHTYTLNLICNGVYHETSTAPKTCSNHANCTYVTEYYWAGGRCTKCQQYYYLSHPEYHVHSSNGEKVRCCWYY